ncbi:unnamed protein product [Clonostachys solani]|uniref:Uncharacterized protein n=1 Tax=Clonostachys solani TaxID=160281 RepID=A0A9N9Z2S5_9HYPO|nr:unnamed protein product [Clonostachys solani]
MRTDASGLQSTRPDPSKLHQGMVGLEAVAWHLAESVLGRIRCSVWLGGRGPSLASDFQWWMS